MRKLKLSGSAAKGASAVLAALAVAAAVTSAIYPWMRDGARDATIWETWTGWLDEPVGRFFAMEKLPLAALLAGFALVLCGLAGRGRLTFFGAIAFLAAAPLYYVAVVQEAGSDAGLLVGFWLVILAAGLAFASGKASPGRA